MCFNSGGTLLNLVLSTFVTSRGVRLCDLVISFVAGMIYEGRIRLICLDFWTVYLGKPGGSGNFLTTSASNSGLEFN